MEHHYKFDYTREKQYELLTTVREGNCMIDVKYDCVLKCNEEDLNNKKVYYSPYRREGNLSKYLHVYYEQRYKCFTIGVDENCYYSNAFIESFYLGNFENQVSEKDFIAYIEASYSDYLAKHNGKLSFESFAYSIKKLD